MTRHGLPPGSTVVGVDGSEGAGRAVAWAAAQPALEHRLLALVRRTDLALRDTAWLDAPAPAARASSTPPAGWPSSNGPAPRWQWCLSGAPLTKKPPTRGALNQGE